MSMHQKSLDYKKHCSIPFSAYVQVHTDPDQKNTQHPRTLDCIYLRYVDNNQGWHHLLDLQTGRTIKRSTITTIPITENVIDLIHNMAENNNMEKVKKIETRSGTILYDSSWIAGLDYDLTTENEENHGENQENSYQNEGGPENTDVDVVIPDELAEIMKDKTSQTLVEFNDNNANAEKWKETTKSTYKKMRMRQKMVKMKKIKQMKKKMTMKMPIQSDLTIITMQMMTAKNMMNNYLNTK
jgi:hypothetical protein